MTNLEMHRRIRQMNQKRFAELLGEGFTASQLSLIESGRLKPSPRQAARLTQLLGADCATLLLPAQIGSPDEFKLATERVNLAR